MENLINEAKDIIEMSLNPQVEKEAYALRANDWLKRVEAHQQTGDLHQHHHKDVSCAICIAGY